MKTLLFVAVLLVISVAGLGWYMGWFKVSSGGVDGRPGVSVSVDQEKIDADRKAMADKISPP